MVAQLEKGQIQVNSFGKYLTKPLVEDDVVMYRNGKLVLKGTKTNFINALLLYGLFNPKAK